MDLTETRAARSSPVNAKPPVAASSLRSAALPALALVAVLVGGELALRAASFSPSVVPHRIALLGDEADRALERGDGLLRFDAEALWTLRPGAEIPWAHGERVSPHGLRGVEPPLAPTPGRLRVALLGGSSACGVGVAFDETCGGRLAAELEALGVPCDVVCAGVPQASIRQALAHWRGTARAFRPDVVVYATSRGIGWEPAVDRLSDEQKILFLARHPERWREAEVTGGLRLAWLGPWLVSIADGSYWRERYAAMEARRSELIHLGQDASIRRLSIDELLRCLDQLQAETAAAGARFCVLSIPRDPDGPEAASPAAAAYQAALVDWVRAHDDAALINGREAFAALMKERGVERSALFLEDDLPSDIGHAALARALAEEVRRGLDRRPERERDADR